MAKTVQEAYTEMLFAEVGAAGPLTLSAGLVAAIDELKEQHGTEDQWPDDIRKFIDRVHDLSVELITSLGD